MSEEVKESKREKKERKERKKEKKEKKEKKVKKEKKKSDSESGSENDEEIEIDLNGEIPLNKKQQRLLKKGKLDLDKLSKKHPVAKPILTAEEEEEEAKKAKKSPYGVWVGNLSFDTTKEQIVNFVLEKTASFTAFDDSQNDDDFVKVENIDITRINMPKKGNKIKGFAYLDLPSKKHVKTVVSLSEGHLNGRRLLIKDSTSFEGRPDADTQALSKNPPSRILFVGNLSFDTTQDLLEEHFRHCGDIIKIRMATFEDTGKCKGFAFVDFKDESGPTTALKSKLAKKFINRPLRLEYGEDRSKRRPGQGKRNADGEEVSEGAFEPREIARERPERNFEEPREKRPRVDRPRVERPRSDVRVKSSVALATAQRASAAIVPSQGKKTTFD